MRMGCSAPWSTVRLGIVFLTGAVVTWNYYRFSHFVHDHHHFSHLNNDTTTHTDDNDTGGDQANDPQHHSRGGPPMEGIYLKKDGLLLYGIAIPIVVLALVSLIWNPRSTPGKRNAETNLNSSSVAASTRHSRGDVHVQKWTILWFLLPLLFVLFDSAYEHFSGGRSQEKAQMGWSWFNSVLTSFMSPTGYAAVWALAAFLFPVTKHSPVLDWLRITPIQALAFHRLAGWTSLFFSVAHGFLHLRHLMDVLRRGNPRPWYRELYILLVPPSWECVATQTPFQVFFPHHQQQTPIYQQDKTCWLALVNATGMISVLAFLVLAVTSLPQFRRAWYSVFYRVHIPMAWIMLLAAIWHYPTCGLFMIPNIIYYLSFLIPVKVAQAIEAWGKALGYCNGNKEATTTLLEANLIQGGIVELTFAIDNTDQERHESRFVNVSHPDISCVAHPFSVFSSQDLVQGRSNGDGSSYSTTLSILYRSTGPFTKELTLTLFPNQIGSQGQQPIQVPQEEDGVSDTGRDRSGRKTASVNPNKIQCDSFYAGSFDWIDGAMDCHDEILVVAGGVGIVPFLNFLPLLQQRIVENMTALGPTDLHLHDIRDGPLLVADPGSATLGPRRIHVHWYCRDICLASFVWHKHLGRHVHQVWESNRYSQGRLVIHMHLTGLERDGQENQVSEAIFDNSNMGMLDKRVFTSSQGGQEDQSIKICPVQDSRAAQSWILGLMLPGFIMVTGMAMHVWWYKRVVIMDEFREDNLILRSHSIAFTVLFGLVLSISLEGYFQWRDNNKMTRLQSYNVVPEHDTIAENDVFPAPLHHKFTLPDTTSKDILEVTAGRPCLENVTREILKAHRPGIYMCGPRTLMDSVETFIQQERKGCAFYREDSEM